MRAITKAGMKIMPATSADVQLLSAIYKASFTTHNIFQKPAKEIRHYLQETQQKNSEVSGGFLVAKVPGKVIGGILLKKESEERQHQRWKFNHLAVDLKYQRQGVGTRLMNAAEQKIRKQLQRGMTAKIELHVSEKEKSLLEFYLRFGFVVEGKLTSHYRQGEVVYAMGKEVGK